jgi:3-methyladenine DNA glycosylase/8-oxoguanine DNA glycosylase
MSKFSIKVEQPFSFKSTVYSHGWVDLPPFVLATKPLSFLHPLKTISGDVIKLNISNNENTTIVISVNDKLADKDVQKMMEMMQRIFRLNEDFSGFYRYIKGYNQYKWIVELAAGRLLRSASLWEDMVKMICTTNCNWRQTRSMVNNLVQKLGCGDSEFKTFPTPEKIVGCTEKYLREKIKLGYRAPYILELAIKIIENNINLISLENWKNETKILYKEMLKIKGFGKYAAGNILKLIGKYDYLGLDSWSRKQFYQKHNKGKFCSDQEISHYYQEFAEWAGLLLWLDLSEEWYKKEIPW